MARRDRPGRVLLTSLIAVLLSSCNAAPDSEAKEGRQGSSSAPETQSAGGEPVIDPAQAKQELVRLEQAYSKALITKDRAFLEAYYAPDFRGGNYMGFWSKSTMLKAVLDDRYSVQSMDLSRVETRIVGKVGIVQGVSTEVTRINGKDTSGRWGFTDIFEHRDGRWVAVASHTSELKPDGKTQP